MERTGSPDGGRTRWPPQPTTRRAATLTRGVALSYARIFLATVILITVAFYLLKVTIVAAIFGVFALIVLAIVLKEGL
jgi:membrane protein required for beta-lactamase induction